MTKVDFESISNFNGISKTNIGIARFQNIDRILHHLSDVHEQVYVHPVHAFSSFFPFNRFDAFIFVIHGKLHESDENIFRLISQSNKYIIVVRSFSDGIDMYERLPIENDIRRLLALQKSIPVVFVSNRTGEGVDVVFNSIRS